MSVLARFAPRDRRSQEAPGHGERTVRRDRQMNARSRAGEVVTDPLERHQARGPRHQGLHPGRAAGADQGQPEREPVRASRGGEARGPGGGAAAPLGALPALRSPGAVRGPRRVRGLEERRRARGQRLERADRGAAPRHRGPRHAGGHPGADLHPLRPPDGNLGRRGRAGAACDARLQLRRRAPSWPRRGRPARASPSSARPTTPRAACSLPKGSRSLPGDDRARGGRRGLPRVRGDHGRAPARAPREPRGAAHLLQGHGPGGPARRATCWPPRAWCARSTRRGCPTT